MATIYMTDQCCPCEGLTNPCCESGNCCMYPADQYNKLFHEGDLPEELIINVNGVGSFAAIKNQTNNGIYSWEIEPQKFFAIRYQEGQWTLFTSEFPNEQPPTTRLGLFNCLLLGEYIGFFPNPTYEDAFEDVYNVIGFGATVPVERVGLCRWEKIGHLATVDGDLRTYSALLEYVIELNEDGSVAYLGWRTQIGYGTVNGQGDDNSGYAYTMGSMHSPVNTYIAQTSGGPATIIVSQAS